MNFILKNIFLYHGYILKHKWFVFVECYKLGIPWQGIIHDLSKYRPVEFYPYMDRFYGSKQTSPEFLVAWQQHVQSNPHHWQSWVALKGLDENQQPIFEPLKIPEKYVKEMIADWRGMAKTVNSSGVNDWYLKNRYKILLNIETRLYVENELGV